MDLKNDEILLRAALKRSELEALPSARLTSLLADAPPLAAKMLGGDIGDQTDASIIIDNAGQIMAIALEHHDALLYGKGIESLAEIWKNGDYEALYPVKPPDFEASLWEALGINLYALGGIAVAQERWPEIRALTLQAPTGGPRDKSWLRQGQVVSSRANDDYPEESILRLADRRLRKLSADISEDESLRHLARFDLLSDLIIGEENQRGFFPNAAELDESLVEPLIIDELRSSDSALRQYVFPGDTPTMVKTLAEYDRMARYQAALARYRNLPWGWRGFSDARTLAFLAEEHILEEWASAG